MHKPVKTVRMPTLAYRAWFLFVMMMVSASVVGERFMMAVMVEPIRKDLGLSDTAIGLVKDMAIVVVYVLAVIPVARVTDRWSKRKMVAIAAALWSVAVILCGFAQGFWVLLIGRIGIGLGEGAFTPASQAWVADMSTTRQRATMIAIFLLGASLGNFAGPALGGWLAHAYGWRSAMFLAAIPGFVLVPLVWLTLYDVPPGFADGHVARTAPTPFREAVRELMAIRTLPPFILASAFVALLTMGLVSWTPAFMQRSHGIPAQVAGLEMGAALFVGSVLGHSLGGPLADWLGRRDLRWYAWTLMIGGVCTMVLGFLLLRGPASTVFPLLGVSMLLGGLSAAPMIAVVTGLAPAELRSTAVAITMVAINVIGLGGGPLLVGFLSDMLHPVYGDRSLGIAMQCTLVVGVPATVLAWIASCHSRADFAKAGVTAAIARGAPSMH
jgi:MFS family permease